MPAVVRRAFEVTAAAVCCALLGLVQPVLASARPDAVAIGRPSAAVYLALGDSLTAGVQPTSGADARGGYVGHVLAALREDTPPARLVNLACPGESVVTMAEGGRCDYRQGSQLAQALAFLRNHQRSTRLITLTVGANDVLGCVSVTGIDPQCVVNGLTTVASRLPGVLAALRAAAPGTQIVVLNYYDPVLAAWLRGEAGRQLARDSVPLLQQLNAIIAGAATAVGAQTADVAGAFATTDFDTIVTLPGIGPVPLNVARVCQWTWMCSPYADIHANDAGYAVMAQTVTSLLPAAGSSRARSGDGHPAAA